MNLAFLPHSIHLSCMNAVAARGSAYLLLSFSLRNGLDVSLNP